MKKLVKGRISIVISAFSFTISMKCGDGEIETRNLLSTRSRNELLACEISLLQCLVIVIHAVGQVSMGALPVRHPMPMLALKYSKSTEGIAHLSE
jgi:hypothetical protein